MARTLEPTESGIPVADRRTLDDATALIADYGLYAVHEAAERAERSRDVGNALHFCHWRQVERMILLLATEHVQGTIH